MYYSTLSTSITEATTKMLALRDVCRCSTKTLTDAQNDCLYEYFHEMCFGEDDKQLALDNLYVDRTTKHLYVIEACDWTDDTLRYYYEELIPTVTLYKDDLGNLYYDEGKTENGLHLLVLVEKAGDHYTYTNNTWYEDTDRLSDLYTKIEAEVR